MKKLIFFSIIALALSSCEKEITIDPVTNKHLEMINSRDYMTFNSQDEIIEAGSKSNNTTLKSGSDFTSMWDVYCMMEEYSTDSTKIELFNRTVE